MLRQLTDPFAALLELQREIDALMGSSWLAGSTAASGTYPPINIFRRGDDYVAVIELPGVSKSDIQVEVKRNQLRVAGTRRPVYGDGTSVHRRERSSGSFDRTVVLPVEIDATQVNAEYREGILAVLLPCVASERATEVKIH